MESNREDDWNLPPWLAATVVVVLIGLLALAVLFPWATPAWLGTIGISNPDGSWATAPRTLWDVLELLLIPAVLAAAAYFIKQADAHTERVRTEDRYKIEQELSRVRTEAAALEAYLDQMSALLIDKGLLSATRADPVAVVAKARTLTVLRRLDGERKATVIRFVRDTGLIDRGARIITLPGADLRSAKLRHANLQKINLANSNLDGAILDCANLSSSILVRANLHGAKLSNATCELCILERANLSAVTASNTSFRDAKLLKANCTEADFSGAKFQGASLVAADLRRANLCGAELEGCNIRAVRLEGAQYDKSTTWPQGFRPVDAGAIEVRTGAHAV